MSIKSAIQYNDGLDTWVRRFSTRKLADSIATSIRERGIEARLHDRSYNAAGNYDPKGQRVRRSCRYEILVKKPDFARALIIANHEIQIRREGGF